MSEAPLIRATLIFLRSQGCFVDRMNSGAVRLPGRGGRERFLRFGGRPGIPDIVGVGPDGRYIGVEVKRGRAPISPAQAAFHAEIRQRGGFVAVVHSPQELAIAWRTFFGTVKGEWG